CAKNILLFAKGTTEIGELGITVGPVLYASMPRDWTVVGIPYEASINGDFCLGLPGGMVGRDMLESAAAKCPSSKIFVSGYSQGAMVAHNAVAYATNDAKGHVTGVVTFGDPFQGAKIKGYSGPIVTYCNAGDGVCTGNFELAGSHLAY
ncbi:alpha/beta-hydrolase, partial [Microthyrium microscopicum]